MTVGCRAVADELFVALPVGDVRRSAGRVSVKLVAQPERVLGQQRARLERQQARVLQLLERHATVLQVSQRAWERAQVRRQQEQMEPRQVQTVLAQA